MQIWKGSQPRTYPASIAAFEVRKCGAPDVCDAFNSGITLQLVPGFLLRTRAECQGKDAMDKAYAGAEWRSLQGQHTNIG